MSADSALIRVERVLVLAVETLDHRDLFRSETR
jgi:hypothetical protein